MLWLMVMHLVEVLKVGMPSKHQLMNTKEFKETLVVSGVMETLALVVVDLALMVAMVVLPEILVAKVGTEDTLISVDQWLVMLAVVVAVSEAQVAVVAQKQVTMVEEMEAGQLVPPSILVVPHLTMLKLAQLIAVAVAVAAVITPHVAVL
jgi:hypothetical protein